MTNGKLKTKLNANRIKTKLTTKPSGSLSVIKGVVIVLPQERTQ